MACNDKVVLCFKRGDTFELSGILQDEGIPVNLTGYSIAAQIRNGGWLVSTLQCTITDAVLGQYNIFKAHADTKDWPTRDLEMDIEFTTADSKRISTETIIIRVEIDQTL